MVDYEKLHDEARLVDELQKDYMTSFKMNSKNAYLLAFGCVHKQDYMVQSAIADHCKGIEDAVKQKSQGATDPAEDSKEDLFLRGFADADY